MSSIGHFISVADTFPTEHFMKVLQSPQIVQFFLILGLVFSSVGGLVVAAILKKLDNVVKVNNFILSYKI